MDWKDASVSKVICRCKNVTKKEIIEAIHDGARDLDAIRAMTGACLNDHLKDPACMDCHVNVQEMLNYYAPFADAIKR
jgi:NAD(P)H-nitrite reductase large subunit